MDTHHCYSILEPITELIAMIRGRLHRPGGAQITMKAFRLVRKVGVIMTRKIMINIKIIMEEMGVLEKKRLY
jgi:hypothetical protein